MRLTLDVELGEGEMGNAAQVQQALEALSPKVVTRMTTDKAALASRVAEAIASHQYDSVCAELLQRLSYPPLAEDCVDVMCVAALFSVQRHEKGEPVEPFVEVVCSLPEPQQLAVRKEIVQRAMVFLSTPRRLDCSRLQLLPYAETLAAMTKADLLKVRNIVVTIVKMIHLETTRTAGMTCLGKLVEISYAALRKCDVAALDAVRAAVSSAQQDDTFLYDVEYIMEAFGWTQNKPMLTMLRTGSHHTHPILAIAYTGSATAGYREAVVSSSVDGTIGTWDRSGALTENIVLSRHYASSLDLANSGHTLIVGTVARQSGVPPAVIIYSEDTMSREARWHEGGGVEPKNARFITCVKALPTANTVRYGVGVSSIATSRSGGAHSLHVYDNTQQMLEFTDHSDIITALHAPPERDSLLISGSRDRSVMLFDLRSRQAASCLTNHINTVTSIGTCADFLITGGLDKRIVVEDLRMLGQPIASREMDSSVLSLSVNNGMQCAVSTLTGIYVINFQNGAQVPTSSRSGCGHGAQRYNAIAWNHTGALLYAGGEGKSLDVFRRTFPDGDGYDN